MYRRFHYPLYLNLLDICIGIIIQEDHYNYRHCSVRDGRDHSTVGGGNLQSGGNKLMISLDITCSYKYSTLQYHLENRWIR